MPDWVVITYAQAIPCFVLGLILYFLRICSVRPSKLDSASWLREILVFLAFLFHVAIFIFAMKLPRIVVEPNEKTDGTGRGWLVFGEMWFLSIILRLLQEDFVKLAYASTWLSLAVIHPNKKYHRFVKGVFFFQVLYLFRVVPLLFSCQKFNDIWKSGVLTGLTVPQCWKRSVSCNFIIFSTILDDIILWSTPIPIIRSLPHGRQRKMARITLGCIVALSTVSNIAGTWVIVRGMMIEELDASRARNNLLAAFQLTFLRPALLLSVPCLSAAVHTIRSWHTPLLAEHETREFGDIQTSESSAGTSDSNPKSQLSSCPDKQDASKLIICDARTEHVRFS